MGLETCREQMRLAWLRKNLSGRTEFLVTT
jgi:hypothetical protein